MTRPKDSEYDPYYRHYVSLVPEDDIIPPLEDQPAELRSLIGGLPEDRGTFAYADGKWTIKELLSHLIDGERMFAYRVLRISRADKTPIEGFDQDGYIENSHANGRSFSDLLSEFELLRQANVFQFRNMEDGDWGRTGTTNKVEVSVRALAWIMVGHVRHHIDVLGSKYLGQNGGK